MKIGHYLVAGMLLVSAFFWGWFLKPQPVPELQGAVVIGGEYQSTSTNYKSTNSTVLCSGGGALGSVVITGANTGIISFYNVTTTNLNLRTDQKPTSTILLPEIPTSAAAGTYTFDVVAPIGLWMDISGAKPTSTITYRCN